MYSPGFLRAQVREHLPCGQTNLHIPIWWCCRFVISFLAKININFYFGPEMCCFLWRLRWAEMASHLSPLVTLQIFVGYDLFSSYINWDKLISVIHLTTYHAFWKDGLLPRAAALDLGRIAQCCTLASPLGKVGGGTCAGVWGKSHLKTRTAFPMQFGCIEKCSKEPSSHWVKLCDI